MAKKIAKQLNADDYSIYKNKYTFIMIDFLANDYNNLVYATIVNGKLYMLQFQDVNSFTNERKEIIKEIVDNASFNVDVKGEREWKKNRVLTRLISLIYPAFLVGLTFLLKKLNLKERLKR